MALSEDFLDGTDIHPIDVVENVALAYDWEFDRVAHDQIAMTIEGQWRSYSVTLAWSDGEETLRLISTFEIDPPKEREAALFELLNLINDQCWTGAFTFWAEQKLMVWRYGLVLAGGQVAAPEQIDRMLRSALTVAERFYPAMQLATWGSETPEAAMKVAIAEAYGRA